MAKTMTPSASETKAMTDGQITKAVAAYRALLEKHAPEFDSGVVQAVLGNPRLAGEMFVVFRVLVEAQANEIVRRVSVANRNVMPQEMLDDLRRKQYTNKDVVKTMPKGEGEEVEVVFFTLGRYISDNDLEKEYELRGLKAADPYSLAAVNKADPAFADECPNCTHWKQGDSWHFVTFRRWIDEWNVIVDRDGNVWRDFWWFAGVRK